MLSLRTSVQTLHTLNIEPQIHLHAIRYQNMIVLFISLNVMIKALSACYHCKCSTSLSKHDKKDTKMKHSLTIVLLEEQHANCEFNP